LSSGVAALFEFQALPRHFDFKRCRAIFISSVAAQCQHQPVQTFDERCRVFE
jgi:hypothetical protein